MVGDNLEAVNLKGAVRVSGVTQPDEGCSILVLFIETDVKESLFNISWKTILLAEESE